MEKQQTLDGDCYFKTFPRNLREAMQDKRITQAEIGEALGKTRQAVAAYSAGKSIPDAETLADLSKLLGVSADWLLGLSQYRTTNPTLQAAAAYTGLTENALEALRFHATHVDVDRGRYLAFLSSLLEDASFRQLLLELYRFTTANEGKRLYEEMQHQFKERKERGDIHDHAQYTEEWLGILKRQDIPDEVKGMFLAQVKLESLDSGEMQDLTKDVQLVEISEVKRLAAMQAFNHLISEDSESPCFKAIQTHKKAASEE